MELQTVIKYENIDIKIHSVYFQSNKLFFSSKNGISVVHLDTKVYCRIINTTDPATICSLCSFQGAVLFSDESKFSLYKITSDFSVSHFPGTETEGSLDGSVRSCQFMQPKESRYRV